MALPGTNPSGNSSFIEAWRRGGAGEVFRELGRQSEQSPANSMMPPVLGPLMGAPGILQSLLPRGGAFMQMPAVETAMARMGLAQRAGPHVPRAPFTRPPGGGGPPAAAGGRSIRGVWDTNVGSPFDTRGQAALEARLNEVFGPSYYDELTQAGPNALESTNIMQRGMVPSMPRSMSPMGGPSSMMSQGPGAMSPMGPRGLSGPMSSPQPRVDFGGFTPNSGPVFNTTARALPSPPSMPSAPQAANGGFGKIAAGIGGAALGAYGLSQFDGAGAGMSSMPEDGPMSMMPESSPSYTAQRGDTLFGIAEAVLGPDASRDAKLALVQRIAQSNGVADPNRISVGQNFSLPSAMQQTPNRYGFARPSMSQSSAGFSPPMSSGPDPAYLARRRSEMFQNRTQPSGTGMPWGFAPPY